MWETQDTWRETIHNIWTSMHPTSKLEEIMKKLDGLAKKLEEIKCAGKSIGRHIICRHITLSWMISIAMYVALPVDTTHYEIYCWHITIYWCRNACRHITHLPCHIMCRLMFIFQQRLMFKFYKAWSFGVFVYHIVYSIQQPGKEPWRLTCVYGEAQTHLRHITLTFWRI